MFLLLISYLSLNVANKDGIIRGVTILLCIIFRLTYKADQKDNIFKNNEDGGVAQKNKDECNNTVKEESIKTIDSV